MKNLTEFGKEYLLLGLRLKHFKENYVFAYYGPPELEKQVDMESKPSPKELLKNCQKLQKNIHLQGFEKIRERNLINLISISYMHFQSIAWTSINTFPT